MSGYQQGRTEYRADLDGTSLGNSLFGDKVDEVIDEAALMASYGRLAERHAAGEVDDEVGPEPSAVDRRLLVEVGVLDQAGELGLTGVTVPADLLGRHMRGPRAVRPAA